MGTEKTASFMDKSKWERGPWDSEPDRMEFRVPDCPGFACLMVRNLLGSWCGYVGVPPGHRAHGKWLGDADLMVVKVHGGITYAAPCEVEGDRDPGELICHVPEPGESEDIWWLGFDCGHAFDVSPELAATIRGYSLLSALTCPRLGCMPEVLYRDASYVRAEVESLARQLAAMGERGDGH